MKFPLQNAHGAVGLGAPRVLVKLDPVLARRLGRVLAYIVDGGTQPSEGVDDAHLR